MALTKIGASLGGGADTISVTQSNHGLLLGYPVKVSGNGTFSHATADSEANADAVGIVIETDWDGSSGDNTRVLIALSGKVTADGALPSGNVAAGTVLYLPTSAGKLTTDEPDGNNEVSKPMAVVSYLNSEMILINYRGEVISTAGVSIADGSITLAKLAHTDNNDINKYLQHKGSSTDPDWATLSLSGDTTISSGDFVIGTNGKGIDFSAATGSASGAVSDVLKFYEEGTFTPSLADNSNTLSNSNHNGQVGRYTRIGNRCFFQLFVRTTSTSGLTGGDQAYIVGLPFASVNVTYAHAAINAGAYGSLGTGNALGGDIIANSQKIRLQRVTGSAGTLQMTVNEWSSDGEAIISGHYEVAV